MAKDKKTDDKTEKAEGKGGKPKTTDEGVSSFDDSEYLIKWILDCKKEAEDATSSLRDRWQELWQIYQNRQDYSKKQSWQSQTCIPKIFMAIERASLLIERATLQTSKLFHIELDDEFVLPLKSMIRLARKDCAQSQEQAHKIYVRANDMLKRIEQAPAKSPEFLKVIETQQKMIDQADAAIDAAKEKVKALEDKLHEYEEECKEDDARFKAHLKKTNFVSAYGEMTKPACLLGIGVIKRLWNGRDKRLSYETKDVQNTYISPDYLPFQDEPPRYFIEYKEMQLCDLIEVAREANKNLEESGEKGKVFDMAEIDKITETGEQKAEENAEQNQRRGLDEHETTSKKVKILEFWGTVVSKDGREKKKDRLMMLANERYLIRNQDNPHDDKKLPYDFCVPMPYPHRGLAGTSMVEAEIKLQYTLNNLLNMFIDNLNFSVNTMLEYDPQKLLEPSKMHSVFPGKLIKLKPGTASPVITQVYAKGITADAFKVFEMVTMELQEGTAVTEFLTAMPGGKSKTLGEIEIKTSESHGYFDVIARKIEINSIRNLLMSSYGMLCQFAQEFKNPERYQFNVGGLSLLLLQKQQVEYLVQALSLAIQNEQLSQWTDVKDLWERLLSIWNLDESHREEEPEQMMKQRQMPQQPQRPQLPPGQAQQQPQPMQVAVRGAI